LLLWEKGLSHCGGLWGLIVRSSIVEVVRLEGLELKEKIEVSGSVLDVAFKEDRMYVSLDAQEGDWIVEYRYSDDTWTKVDTDRWRIGTREESKAEIFWLETMRKRVGHADDD
jgi:hypothetical protein